MDIAVKLQIIDSILGDDYDYFPCYAVNFFGYLSMPNMVTCSLLQIVNLMALSLLNNYKKLSLSKIEHISLKIIDVVSKTEISKVVEGRRNSVSRTNVIKMMKNVRITAVSVVRIYLIVFVCSAIFGALIIVFTSWDFSEQKLIPCNAYQELPFFFLGIVWNIVSMSFLYLMRNLKDLIGLGRESTINWLCTVVCLLGYAICSLIGGSIMASAFVVAYGFVTLIVSTIMPLQQAFKSPEETDGDSIKETNELFRSVLNNPFSFEKLKSIGAAMLSIENMIFIETVAELYKKIGRDLIVQDFPFFRFRPKVLTQEEEDSIVKEYLERLSATFLQRESGMELNIPDDVRKEFLRQMRNSDNVSLEILQPIVKAVFEMVYQNIFPRFLVVHKTQEINRMIQDSAAYQ